MMRSSWKRQLVFAGVAGVGALAFCLVPHWLSAENPVPRPNAGLQKLAVGRLDPARLKDFSKGVIERPTENLLVNSSNTAVVAGERKAANPRVQPGQVAWHATFEQACTAARRSGKPVLLFSMMGRLDEQFC